jgi:hypothetical protein
MTTFKTFDAKGNVIDEQTKNFANYKRFSMRCAAQQKHLDKMNKPGVVKGEIIESHSTRNRP